jgi:bifunctional UDP-N-acetylglucosamine pyrophosphorylase/glucosamine-1-phosphate N-acetyltransferase
LEEHIDALEKNEIGKEFYFTDIVKRASGKKLPVVMVESPFDQVRGINTFQELWAAQQIKRGELIKYWMDQGVRFPMAQNVHIDLEVTLGVGSTIGSGVQLLGRTVIGTNSQVGDFSMINNSSIGDTSCIHSHSVIKDSSVGSGVNIGPFAHVHSNSVIGDQSIIGNFVEVKKSVVGIQTKAKHLAYLGDAQIGSGVNIGAGTIICNHNGTTKNTTIIHDGAYVGSNSTLIAPLTLGQRAFTAAGSVITQDVPADALAIGRSHQVNKEGYAIKLRERATAGSAPAFVGAIKPDSTVPTE